MPETVRDRILAWLEATGTPHTRLDHAETFTAAEAAAARGRSQDIGGKALVLVLEDGSACVLALSAARRTDNQRLRRTPRCRLRFATPEELLALTGLTPGCVPPLGAPIFALPLYVDQSLLAQPQVAFTPGDHSLSVFLATADYLRLAAPTAVVDVAQT